MTRSLTMFAWVLLWLFATAAPAHADGPGSYQPPARPSPKQPALSEVQAIEAYNLGYAAIQRADHAAALAEATSDRKEQRQAQSKSAEEYEQARRHFEEAVRLDAYLHEGFTYLGYANRKLGRHTQALDAYRR